MYLIGIVRNNIIELLYNLFIISIMSISIAYLSPTLIMPKVLLWYLLPTPRLRSSGAKMSLVDINNEIARILDIGHLSIDIGTTDRARF